MTYKIYFILASLVLLGGNISHVLGDATSTTSSSVPGKDVLTELSAAGTLVLLILYIVFDFLKNKKKNTDQNMIVDNLEDIVILGKGGSHSLVTDVALIKSDIKKLKEAINRLEDSINRMTHKTGNASSCGVHYHPEHNEEEEESS